MGKPLGQWSRHMNMATIQSEKLPDSINDADKSILDQIIECTNASSECMGSGVFKLILRELRFYKKNKLPLPRLCPLCRHQERIKQRNPMKLWDRQCQCAGHQSDNKAYQNEVEHANHKDRHCSNKFQTTYAPDRKEIIYCEKCYQKEIE